MAKRKQFPGKQAGYMPRGGTQFWKRREGAVLPQTVGEWREFEAGVWQYFGPWSYYTTNLSHPVAVGYADPEDHSLVAVARGQDWRSALVALERRRGKWSPGWERSYIARKVEGRIGDLLKKQAGLIAEAHSRADDAERTRASMLAGAQALLATMGHTGMEKLDWPALASMMLAWVQERQRELLLRALSGKGVSDE